MDKTIQLDEFKKELADMFDVKLREAGFDKTDKKDINDKGEDKGLGELTGHEKIAKFLQAVVTGDKTTAKALSEGVGADGGFLVPTEFRAEIVAKLLKAAVIRPRTTVIPMGRDKMEVPADANNVAAAWTAENAALTESNPTLAQIILNTNKLTGLSKMSRELFADSAINVVDYVTGLFARKFAAEEDKAFMTGSGSGQPKGIRQYTVTSLAQLAAALTGDDIIKLFYTLPSQYRANAVWILHNDVIKLVRLLKDSNNRYLWTDGMNDAPATLLGRPVLEQNDIPVNLGVGTNESEIWFGDLSYYLIGDRQTIEVESTTEGAGAFENHQVAVKVFERLDGQLGQTEAFVKLTAVK